VGEGIRVPVWELPGVELPVEVLVLLLLVCGCLGGCLCVRPV
jgi:hypothetical protein